ncbi:MAG: hypothetical protein ACFBRM_10200 [Pikeienuella sp.]
MLRAIERVAAPFMVRAQSPTADLYLTHACGDWIGPKRPIAQLGPGVFASEETLLVVRHGGRAGRLPKRRRVFWLIDDHIGPARRDTGLPLGQRMKLALFEARHGDRLMAGGAEIVVSSEVLAQAFAGRGTVHRLRPHWAAPLADLAHHDAGAPLRVAFLGSAVHRADLAFLVPVIEALLARHPRMELHLAANHSLGRLSAHPRVVPIDETGWRAYRARLPRRRFQIALYPLLDTEANRARSVNKIIEHAIVGAAGLYSAVWPEAQRVARRGAGLVLANEPEAWIAAATRLIERADERANLAARGRALAADLNHPGGQRAFWRHGFGLSSSF